MENDIQQELGRQSIGIGDPDVFPCVRCANYEGALVCKNRIFIAFVGANLSNCSAFVPGKRCRHCGETT